MPRKSAYRKSYGVGGEKTKEYVVVSVETQKLKVGEKDQMKKLNNRLVNYVDKVHDLEMANKMLAAENARLRKQKKTPENDISQIYEDELRKLRAKIEELQEKNTRLEIERDNLAYDLEETTAKLESEKDDNKELEKEVKSLRKDVDDATIERSNLETKVENLQEAIQLEKQVHEAEMENLRGMIQPVEAPILSAEQPSILPDLNDAIANVRKQYEAFNAKSLEDLDSFYKEKVDSLTKQLKASQDDIRELRVDNAEKRKHIHQLELELEALRGKNDALERSLEHMNERLANETAQNEELIKQMHEELDHTKEDLGQYLRKYQNLNSLNMSLQQEISIYQKVLTGEEARISEIDTSVNTTRRASSSSSSSSDSERGRAASRSSSRHSSRKSSRSSSKSSSRHSSPDRKADIVDQMLKEGPQDNAPATGVISVSWKVKGGTVRPVKPFQPSDDAEALKKAMKGFGTDEDTIITILSKRTKVQRQVIAQVYEKKFNSNLIKDLEKELDGDLKSTVLHLMWKKSELDAQAIRKAIKGLGTDEAVLIEILCTQSSSEIMDIKQDYAQIFAGRDLVTDVEKETSGAFKKFLLAILRANRPVDSGTVVSNLAEEDSKALFAIGVKNWSPDNQTFLQIFTQRSYQHLWYLFKQCWVKLTKDDLLETIEKEVKGDLKRGLMTLIRFSTCIPPVYYAIQLNETMAGKGTEEKQLIYIVTTRSEIDLIDIKEEYQRMYHVEVQKRIENETSGDLKKILLSLLN